MSTKINRLFDFPYYSLEKFNLKNAFNTKYNGVWQATSTKELISKGNAISRGLLRLGIKPNDKIAVISTANRTEWNVMDLGILQIGAQNVPMYPTISTAEYEYIFNHAEITHCFISDEGILSRIADLKGKVSTLKEIYSFDQIEGCNHWSEVLELGKDESNQAEVEKLKDAVKPEDLATIIYTSGTTGTPKGVMLSHKNIVLNTLASQPRVPVPEGNYKIMSFLPVCHIFERMLHYLYMYTGGEIYFAESIEKIKDNVNEVHPTIMSVVPRLLEKIYDGIIGKGSELSGIKRALFFWAVGLGLQWKPYGENGWWYEFQLKIARKLIFSKWKAALGGELTTLVCGSAALQPRLTKVFCASGMMIMEGYGLTETSPVVTVNMYDNNLFKIGSVGTVIKDVEVKIAEDGEILVKGPNVMMGYYKDPEKTAEVIQNGYFHTGDKGEIDANGFLAITGRKKEIFKTSGGKYISPVLLENVMKQSRFIEQILVVGDGQKMPAAIIQPSFDFIKEWAKRKGHTIGETNAEIIANERVIARVQKDVDKKNRKFGDWEKIKVIELTPDVWGIDNNLLTPTMKPKRDEIKAKYIHLYNKIYEIEA